MKTNLRKDVARYASALTASLVLALAFTFGCSGGDSSSSSNGTTDVLYCDYGAPSISKDQNGAAVVYGDCWEINTAADKEACGLWGKEVNVCPSYTCPVGTTGTSGANGGDGCELDNTGGSSSNSVSSSSSSSNNSSSSYSLPFSGMTAEQLVANIKIGWNLGNTLDAHDNHEGWLPYNSSIARFETAWGNPVTTKANITAIKNAGFNAIRIPVSWTKAAGSAPNYTIRTDWMARVKEVVNYAVDNGMYVVLNTHHDEHVFKFTNAQKTTSLTAFKKIWEQIADNFKDYDEKLIFEGLNEPRTIGASHEWTGGNAEERANLNEHYQVFVNAVRASGGNNSKRVLMVNTYAATATATAVNGLVLPNDVMANQILPSIHAYVPYNFALNENATFNSWSASSTADVNAIHNAIQPAYDKFVSKGIPVIMGEFGTLDKNNTAARVAWTEYYVTYAKSKGVKCFLWDDGFPKHSDGRGTFAVFNRTNNTFYFPGIRDALMSGAGVVVTDPGNMGYYAFGLKEDGVSTNYQQAAWNLSSGNLTTAKSASAKLVLVLSSVPNATMQLVWQNIPTASYWNATDILSEDGTAQNGALWDEGTKTLTIDLSTALENYSTFKSATQVNFIIVYYGEDNINDLGIVSANIVP